MRRLAALAVAFGISLSLAPACAPREQIIHVSSDGVTLLVNALGGDVCDKPLTQTNQTVCERALCVWSSPSRCGPCVVDASVKTRVTPPKRGIVIQVLLVDPTTFTVRDKSTCTPLRSCPQADVSCLTTALNDALAGAIGGGLGYSGLKSTNDALPVLAVFEQQDGVSDCDRSTLLECGGMGERAGADETDVLCASGNGGLALAPGSDPTRCPLNAGSGDRCFVQTCNALLRP